VSWLVRRRSGSLDFPAPSLTLRVAARAFEVFRLRHAGSGPSREVSDSVRTLGSWAPLQSLFPVVPAGSLRPPPCIRPEYLGRRTCDLHRQSIVSGFRSTPPPTLPGVHSRARCRSLRSRRFPLRDPVPSSWFCTTPMVSSARRLRACCIPLPVMRFAAFPGTELPFQPVRDRQVRGSRSISRDAVHTPRRIPPDRSRTTSPWPLPPCRYLPSLRLRPPVPLPVPDLEAPSSGRSTSRLSSAVGSVTPPRPFPGAGCPILPLGFVPLQGTFFESQAPCLDPSVGSHAPPKRGATPDQLRSFTRPRSRVFGPGVLSSRSERWGWHCHRYDHEDRPPACHLCTPRSSPEGES